MPEVLTRVEAEDSIEKLSGRDLDAAVAERVMGWQQQPGYNYWMTFSAGGSFKLHRLIATWRPSESIEAAMEVVEKMHELGFLSAMVSTRNKSNVFEWMAQFVDHFEEEFEARSATLPEAICLAALKALKEAQK